MANEEVVDYEITVNDVEEYGYGETGNLATYSMFKYMLDDEEAEEYRKELKKEDPKAYKEYLEFEKEMKKV